MAVYKEVNFKRRIMGKLEHGKDLLEELTTVIRDNGIYLGSIEAIGAVQRAQLGFYDQGTHQYQYHGILKPLEITTLKGNISIRDGEPMVHAHVTLTDEHGKAFGGHLGEGTTVFACEFIITEFEGAELNRELDKKTGLPLWKL